MGDDQEQDDEFSLDQLSAAYAQVLKEQGRAVGSLPEDNGPRERVETDDQASPDRPGSRPASTVEGDPESEYQEAPSLDADADDDLACAISPISILEAILFVGGPKEVKLTSRKIAAFLRDVSPKEISQLVKQLNQTYEKEKRAYRIVNDNQALRMELHPDMIPVQNYILGRHRATRLTQQAIDVLAIVAYNQPIPRERVDQIRAKPSSSILNQMVRRDLLQVEVSITKPAQRLFRTTDRFLDLFGLESVDDLPQSHDVSDIEELAD